MLHYNGSLLRKWRIYWHDEDSHFQNTSSQYITAKGMRMKTQMHYLEKVTSILIQLQLPHKPLCLKQTSMNNNLVILPSNRFAQLSFSRQVVPKCSVVVKSQKFCSLIRVETLRVLSCYRALKPLVSTRLIQLHITQLVMD